MSDIIGGLANDVTGGFTDIGNAAGDLFQGDVGGMFQNLGGAAMDAAPFLGMALGGPIGAEVGLGGSLVGGGQANLQNGQYGTPGINPNAGGGGGGGGGGFNFPNWLGPAAQLIFGANNPVSNAAITGLGGSSAQDMAMRAQIWQAIQSAGGLQALMGKPSDGGNLAGAQKIAGTPTAVPGQDIMKGYATAGGVDLGGSTGAYDLLPHEQEQLNQQVDQINQQRQQLVGQQLQALIKKGMDPAQARLVASSMNQHFDSQVQQLRTNFMEGVRSRRQQTYQGLAPMLEGLTATGQSGEQQKFGEATNLAQLNIGQDMARQGNIGSLLGLTMGGKFQPYQNRFPQAGQTQRQPTGGTAPQMNTGGTATPGMAPNTPGPLGNFQNLLGPNPFIGDINTPQPNMPMQGAGDWPTDIGSTFQLPSFNSGGGGSLGDGGWGFA